MCEQNENVEKAVDEFVKAHSLSEEYRKALITEGRAHTKAPEPAQKPAPKAWKNKRRGLKIKRSEEKPAAAAPAAPKETPKPTETETKTEAEAAPAPEPKPVETAPAPASTEEKPVEEKPAEENPAAAPAQSP